MTRGGTSRKPTPGLILSAAILALAAGRPLAALDAFPGAAGFGADAIGGRGGAVHEVVTLDDSGPGSLRACVEASGPRTCVFRLGGTVQLQSPLRVESPYLTIAGQSAPGGGVAVRLAPSAADPASPLLLSGTHDVVIRHLRLRPGPSQNPDTTDALTLANSHRVIVDHVSMSWATDENFGAFEEVRDVTVQWSIMAEGLRPHSKGSLTCGKGWNCGDLTFHHNLYVSNADRNPELNIGADGHVDVINNVIHNPKSEYAEVWSSWGGTSANIVGNTFRRGPKTNSWAFAVRYHDTAARGESRIYLADNFSDVPLLEPGAAPILVGVPVAPFSVRPEPAAHAYENVLAGAGAWPRDAVDIRLIDEVRQREGRHITTPGGARSWPTLAPGVPPPDDDHDGMADAWERRHGLDPKDPADRNGDFDGDGYTNLEAYLNALAAALLD